MSKSRIVPFVLLSMLLILSLMLGLDNEAAFGDVSSQSTTPVNSYKQWERSSPIQPDSEFDISECGHPRNNNLETVVAGDFNGDGRSDLLCMVQVSSIAWTEAVALATDDGYTEWSIWGTSIGQWADGNCQFLPPADVSGDGLDDQLCLWIDPDDGSSTLYSLDSLGDGFVSFGQGMAFASLATFDPTRCEFFQTVDVGEDGDMDVICHYHYPDNSSKTFYGRHPEGNTSRVWRAISPVVSGNIFRVDYCARMETADVNGNGSEDLICTYVYPSGNSATFVQLIDGETASGWILWSDTDMASDFDIEDCQMLQTGELDGDGRADRICVLPHAVGGTKVLVQTDSDTTTGLAFGKWEDWTTLNISVNFSRCYAFAVSVPELVDANGDGLSDLICAYLEDNGAMTTYVQLGTGTGFTGWELWADALPAVDFHGHNCVQFLLGDAGGDGTTDLICPYRYAGGENATFIQEAPLYRIYTPIIVNP